MSNLYTVKDTTLTALGDAVRKHTGKYISIDEKPEPFFVASGIHTDLEMIGYDSSANRNYYLYTPSIDFKNIPKADMATSWYVEYTLVNSNEVSGPLSTYIQFSTLNSTTFLDDFNLICVIDVGPTASKSGNKTIKILDRWTNGYLLIGLRPDEDNQGQAVSFDIKIWALDANNQYIDFNKYTPLEMVEQINRLDIIPSALFNISNSASYRFAYNNSNWLIDEYGAKITTNNITDAQYMFANSKALTNIPFDINLSKDAPVKHMFENCYLLKEIPQVNIATITRHLDFTYVFAYCQMIREIPEWFIDLIEEDYNLGGSNTTFGPWTSLFDGCYSLRAIPDRVMRSMKNNQMSGTYYGMTYSKPFKYCYSLDELVNITADNYSFTSNQFNGFFTSLGRVKDITFETNEDGSAVVRPWKSQTIDLSSSLIGYVSSNSSIVSVRNNGITADKEVKDDTTYQALKNDPDWFSCNINYSRYNHDSAVNTINSLPDCSATGTNTIKFKGEAGSLTDGGAINTLTEEEIAVATAKGWTVSLV